MDGLFVMGFDDARTLSHPRLRAGPVLVLDQDATPYGLDSVTFDDALAGELAARHLLDLGHRHFGLIEQVSKAGFPHDPAWFQRKTGFERVVLMGGGVLHPDWRLPWARFAYDIAGGEEWSQRLQTLLQADTGRCQSCSALWLHRAAAS